MYYSTIAESTANIGFGSKPLNVSSYPDLSANAVPEVAVAAERYPPL